MAVLTDGDRVFVSDNVRDEVECEFIDRIAGKHAFAAEVYFGADEAFVVSELGESDGTFVPLKLLTRVD